MLKSLIAKIGRNAFKKDYHKLRSKLMSERDSISLPGEFEFELTRFLISGEDHRFNIHIGFDIIAIARAIKKRVINGKREGASTIEQQLVRVMTNDYAPTIKRKLKEICLATTISDIIPKENIPSIYLNIAYYGTNMQGLEQAYLKLKESYPRIDDIRMCAELVARIKYPEPRLLTPSRKSQIDRRTAHLIALRKKHSNYKIFNIYGRFN